jgi:hypothetical protein
MKYQYDIFFEASKLTMTAILCKGGDSLRQRIDRAIRYTKRI